MDRRFCRLSSLARRYFDEEDFCEDVVPLDNLLEHERACWSETVSPLILRLSSVSSDSLLALSAQEAATLIDNSLSDKHYQLVRRVADYVQSVPALVVIDAAAAFALAPCSSERAALAALRGAHPVAWQRRLEEDVRRRLVSAGFRDLTAPIGVVAPSSSSSASHNDGAGAAVLPPQGGVAHGGGGALFAPFACWRARSARPPLPRAQHRDVRRLLSSLSGHHLPGLLGRGSDGAVLLTGSLIGEVARAAGSDAGAADAIRSSRGGGALVADVALAEYADAAAAADAVISVVLGVLSRHAHQHPAGADAAAAATTSAPTLVLTQHHLVLTLELPPAAAAPAAAAPAPPQQQPQQQPESRCRRRLALRFNLRVPADAEALLMAVAADGDAVAYDGDALLALPRGARALAVGEELLAAAELSGSESGEWALVERAWRRVRSGWTPLAAPPPGVRHSAGGTAAALQAAGGGAALPLGVLLASQDARVRAQARLAVADAAALLTRVAGSGTLRALLDVWAPPLAGVAAAAAQSRAEGRALVLVTQAACARVTAAATQRAARLGLACGRDDVLLAAAALAATAGRVAVDGGGGSAAMAVLSLDCDSTSSTSSSHHPPPLQPWQLGDALAAAEERAEPAATALLQRLRHAHGWRWQRVRPPAVSADDGSLAPSQLCAELALELCARVVLFGKPEPPTAVVGQA